MQKHDINVAKRIEFPAAISTESDQCQGYAGLAVSVSGGGGSSENVLQQNINKLGPSSAYLAARLRPPGASGASDVLRR